MKKNLLFILFSLCLISPLHAETQPIDIILHSIELGLTTLQKQMATLEFAGLPYKAGKGISIAHGVIETTSLHHPGEIYQGGVVFFVDETGQHGLVASKRDLNKGEGIAWRNGESGNRVTNARADGIGAGETNTRLIIAQQTIDANKGQFAALLAANYRVLADGETPCPKVFIPESVCYGNWYLPSAYELQLLYNKVRQASLTSFAPEFYWSSTEVNISNALLQNFATGELLPSNKANTMGQVRAISRF